MRRAIRNTAKGTAGVFGLAGWASKKALFPFGVPTPTNVRADLVELRQAVDDLAHPRNAAGRRKAERKARRDAKLAAELARRRKRSRR